MRRSQPDNVVPREADNGTVQDESIARRFPRIGAQFQTRISKSTGFTIRPAPERMSVDFPYMSEKEVGELGNGRVNGMSYHKSHNKSCRSQSVYFTIILGPCYHGSD